MDSRHCLGCRDDFYNGKNDLGVRECWLLRDARLTTRYRLHVDTPMAGYRDPWERVRVPNCYQQPRFVHISVEQWRQKPRAPREDR